MKIQHSFSYDPPFGPFWSVKYLNFWQKLSIQTVHHTFLESRRAVVTKNQYYVLSTHWSQIPIFLDSSSWTTLLNCFVNIVLSLVDKVNIGTKTFVSVIINFQSPSKLDITQSLIQISSRWILQLIALLIISKNYSNILLGQLLLYL